MTFKPSNGNLNLCTTYDLFKSIANGMCTHMDKMRNSFAHGEKEGQINVSAKRENIIIVNMKN